MKNIKKTAVGYIRVSTEDQTMNYSLEYQEEHIKSYCKDNGISLLKIYNEGFGSGTNVENRTVFQEMIANCLQSNEIDYVVVLADHRFARNHADAINLVDRMVKNGTHLICIADNINTSNRSDYDYFKNKSIFSERQRDEIVFNTMYGMRQRAKNGLYNGGRILGYTSSTAGLVIDPKSSIIIKKIFDLYTHEQWGYRKIAQFLNKKHYKTINNGEFDITAVKTILNNPTYNGYVRFEGKLFKGQHQSIIDDKLWDKTQKTLIARSYFPEKVHHGSYFLTGILKCPQCNTSMVHHVSSCGKYRYYKCLNNKNGKNCKANAIHKKYVEEYILSLITSIIRSPQISSLLLRQIEKRISNEIRELKEAITRLKREIEKIDRKIDKTYEVFYKDNNELHLKQVDKLTKHHEAILEHLKTSEQQYETLIYIDLAQIINNLTTNFETYFHLYEETDKRHFLRTLFREIHLNQSDRIQERTIKEIIYTVDINKIPQLIAN
ncbi:MAG: recombinase family protein [Bacteroidales bacterium]|nr:recombinase family protein [Bacteroidales bacterium]